MTAPVADRTINRLVGARIAERRRVLCLSRGQLAERTGYSESLIDKVEQGRRPASDPFLLCVARVLAVDVDSLIGPE